MSTSDHRPESRRSPRRPAAGPLRILAAALCLVLTFASVAPAFALAREADSEGEGSAAPGSIPGLEGGELEPGGEEIALGEVAIGVEEEAEEEEPPPAVEVPPAPEPSGMEPVPAAPPPAPEPSVTEAPPAAPAPTSAPVNEEEPGPSYDPAPPSTGIVEGEALAAPTSSRPANLPPSARGGPSAAAPAPEVASAPEPVAPSKREVAEPQPATPVEPEDTPGNLQGRSSHTVRPGECLWSIAEAALAPGASEARIAAEVARLWRLNAARIGTGDPSLILVGTVLRLH